MTKFKRVLSSSQMLRLWKDADSVYEFGERVEQTILAKLAEQEPVAWTSSKIFGHYATHDTKVSSAEWFKENLDVPLYAHPCVAPVSDKPYCDSQNGRHEPQTPDGTLTDEGTKRHIEYIKRYQRWRRGEDKTMDEMELTPKQIGESLDWLIGVAENHTPDTGKMVKNLRDEFAMAALTGLLSNSGGPIQISSESGWSLVNCTLDDVSYFAYEMADAMLAAAPKFTQADHIPDGGQMIAPDGWQLVPKEPTEEMIQAADDSDREYSKRSFGDGVHLCQSGYDHYITMLAAAPKYTGEK